jgi:hypothetical protein
MREGFEAKFLPGRDRSGYADAQMDILPTNTEGKKHVLSPRAYCNPFDVAWI